MKNVVFDFEAMTNKDKSSKVVIASFKKAGATVIQVDVLSTTKRTSGISYRELSLAFADSQTVIFRVKQSGDIFQVLLNGKVKPITKQDDHTAAIVEIVKMMESGRSSFQKKLAKALVKLPPSIKTTVPNKEKLLTEKRDTLKEAVAEAEKILQELKEKPKTTFDSVAQFTSFDHDAHQAATSPYNRTLMPSQEDLLDGNYSKGKMSISGLDISIENPTDSIRKGKDRNGEQWQIKMKHHYGFFDGTEGADGDEVDVFVKNNLATTPDFIYVINQVDLNGDFDEHKVVIGAESEDEAKEIYHSNYKDGWDGLGSIEKLSFSDLKKLLKIELAA